MASRRSARIWTLAAGICWLGAFALTHIPAAEMPKVAASDKILHLLGYAGLTSLILIALSVRGNSLLRRTAIVAFVMPHYALLDEATQPLFNRHASLADWTFDVLGAGLALAAHALACLWLSARASQSE